MKAHDGCGCKSGNLKALGSEQVDGLAKQAADGADAKYLPQARYAEAVFFSHSSSRILLSMSTGRRLEGAWEHFERKPHLKGWQAVCKFYNETMQGKIDGMLRQGS